MLTVLKKISILANIVCMFDYDLQNVQKWFAKCAPESDVII